MDNSQLIEQINRIFVMMNQNFENANKNVEAFNMLCKIVFDLNQRVEALEKFKENSNPSIKE